MHPAVSNHTLRLRWLQAAETVREDLISYAASKPVRCRRGGIVYSQLKGRHGAACRDKSLRAVILGAPISKAKAQEIPHQIRLCRSGVNAAAAALSVERQIYFCFGAGKFRRCAKRTAYGRRRQPCGKTHLCAQRHCAEWVLAVLPTGMIDQGVEHENLLLHKNGA